MYKVHYFYEHTGKWVTNWTDRFSSETEAAEAISSFVKMGSVTEYVILPEREEC